MLGASICLLALVSTFVAFGRWPGAQSGTAVDQLVLRSVATAHHGADVTVSAHPAPASAQPNRAPARGSGQSRRSSAPGGGSAPSHRRLAAAPSSPAGGESGGTRSGGSAGGPGNVTQPVQNVTNGVKDTT